MASEKDLHDAVKEIDDAIQACNDIARSKMELLSARRRIREILERTPLRPSSRTDIEAAFDNSVAFAKGEKKP